MNNIKLTFIVILLSPLLTGCLMKLNHPKVVVIDGAFITPVGSHKITTFNKIDVNEKSKVFYHEKHKDYKYMYFYGSDKNVTFTLGALPSHERLKIINNKAGDYKFTLGKMLYYFNGNMEVVASTTYNKNFRVKTDNRKVINTNLVELTLPETLGMLKTTTSGNTLWPRYAELIEKNQNDIHRLKIPFKIDDDEYLIDVSFKVKIRNKWTIGIPGGGP